MAIFITRKALSVSLSSFFIFFLVLQNCSDCSKDDRDSLLLFSQHISQPDSAPLNWSSSNCCNWEGVGCDDRNGRVNSLWLPNRGLSGTINSVVGNLSFLSHLNLSHSSLSGSFSDGIFLSLRHLRVLDLSYNSFNGSVLEHVQKSDSLPVSVETVDISSNYFDGSVDPSLFQYSPRLLVFNISNNTFVGSIPDLICKNATLIRVLDFSMNNFSGKIGHGFGGCSNLEVFRAGQNRLSGAIDSIRMAQLTKLTTLELHSIQLNGQIPKDIGYLTSLESLQLFDNNFTGLLPPSLTNCTRLQVLLLRNNKLGGEVSALDFSKLQGLQYLDLGYNNFTGSFPESLCWCRSLIAIRLAYIPLLKGQLPSCVSRIKHLEHISLVYTSLKNATGALKTLMGCKNLTAMLLTGTFWNEKLPDDEDMEDLDGSFQNLRILTLGEGQFRGRVPNWISKLKKLKILGLSGNKITGPVPAWLGSMPDLIVLNLTGNLLSGPLPYELGNLTAMTTDKSSTDFSYLRLPLLSTYQYIRLSNAKRALIFSRNNLSGSIPSELGRLKGLQELDLSDNKFTGNIPPELSDLVNLETLDLSSSHLTGEIPASLRSLHFVSQFSVAHNDLQGENTPGRTVRHVPRIFIRGESKAVWRSAAYEPTKEVSEDDESDDIPWLGPACIGFSVGFCGVCLALLLKKSWREVYFSFLISFNLHYVSFNFLSVAE